MPDSSQITVVDAPISIRESSVNPARAADRAEIVSFTTKVLARRGTGEESEMPDAKSDTRACPYCKEEVKAAAVRCPHCLADIPARPDHGGVCPLCQEEIKADAIRCQHCKATLVPGARSVFARARRPSLITRRLPVDDPAELGGQRPSAANAGGCADFITHRDMTYHLVDEGTSTDERGVSWHYCSYEPGYGVFPE